MTTKRNLSVRTNTISTLGKSLFLIFALTGSIIIWCLKSLDTPMLVTIIVPATMLVVYCGLTWRTNMFYIGEDQIGDNAYYLGFLYTLSSLAYALWRFQADQGSDPGDIIGTFGVALWSTILGIALRVFFLQLKIDPSNIEKEARTKIAKAANSLSSDLYQASASFNSYTRGLQQSVNEVFNSADSISSKLISALSQLNEKIIAMDSPTDVLNKKLDNVFSSLETSISKLDRGISSQANNLSTLTLESEKFKNNIKSLTDEISTMKKLSYKINEGEKSFDAINSLVQELDLTLKRFSKTMNNINLAQLNVANDVSLTAQKIEAQLEQSESFTKETHKTLLELTKTLREEL